LGDLRVVLKYLVLEKHDRRKPMKKKLFWALFTVIQFIFLSSTFGQNKIESNGYPAPKGYEWMRPTNAYLAFWHYQNKNGYSSQLSPTSARTSWGENLRKASEIKNRWYAAGGNMGDGSGKQGESTVYECSGSSGFGWVAYVALFDGFFPNGGGWPRDGTGIVCGRATEEQAIQDAWALARKKLGSSARAFTLMTGVNAEVDYESWSKNGTISNGQLLAFGGICELPMNEGVPGLQPPPPDDGVSFTRYVKNLGDIKGQGAYSLGGCYWAINKPTKTMASPIFSGGQKASQGVASQGENRRSEELSRSNSPQASLQTQSPQQNQVTQQQSQQGQQQSQAAQQQMQNAVFNTLSTQTAVDQTRKAERRRHEPENEASHCIQPDFGGLYGGMKNTCDFKVWYTYCGYRPKESSWLTGMSCEKQSFGSDSVSPGRTSASHTKGVEMLYWIACKEPAWTVDTEFVPGQGVRGRCYTVGGK
jgi:hypothetical protein